MRARKSIYSTSLALTMALTAALLLNGCEEDSDSAIRSAQDCLNTVDSSNPAKAAECRTMVAGLNSPEEAIITCSSYFLEESFFGNKIVEAMDRISDTANAGENNVLTFVSVFVFSSTANATSANEACQRTGIKGFQLFGDVAVFATTIGSVFPGGIDSLISAATDGETPDVADFKSAVQNISTAAEFSALGESITSLAETLCTAGATEEDVGEDVCPTIELVTSSASAETVGRCIQECMLNSGTNHVCSANTSVTCP